MPDDKSSIISECGTYRYLLARKWKEPDKGLWPPCLFIMLNPSTADAKQDDPTIRRCQDYAARFLAGGLVVANLFAFRATKPADLKAAPDPIGPENKKYLLLTALGVSDMGGFIVCAWGAHGDFMGQGVAVLAMLKEAGIKPWALKLTKSGQPGHPLYLPKSLFPSPIEELKNG